MTPRLLINGAFRPQRITGQQRYASEISIRLLTTSEVQETVPSKWWSSSSLRTWTWVLSVLPARARRSVLVSMTSRAPLRHPRHILIVHDLFVLTNPEWYSRRYVWTHAPLLRAQIRQARAVIAVSEPCAQDLAKYRDDEISVAPNAPSKVFSAPEVPADLEMLRNRGLEPRSYLLTVGSLDPRKNLVRLAAAYARLTPSIRRRYPLVVAGGGASIFRAENANWPTETILLDYVPDDDLRVLYRHAQSVVFVSQAEGFGLPLVEAAAAGAKGLVAADIPVFRWICGDHARYVDPLSVDSIADGMNAELTNSTAPAFDLSPFDWNRSAATVLQVSKRIAEDHSC